MNTNVNFETVQRIRVSMSAAGLDALRVIQELWRFNGHGFDVDQGWSVYEKQIENRVDVTLHEATASEALTTWLTIRQTGAIDCGRIYLADGRDFCAKHLHNLESVDYGMPVQFPGYGAGF